MESHQRTRDIAALYIASGIDPDKATIFLQSQVPAHAELGWLLETQAHFGELKRMTQFKEKSEGQETVSSALFTYPVLMVADVALSGNACARRGRPEATSGTDPRCG